MVLFKTKLCGPICIISTLPYDIITFGHKAIPNVIIYLHLSPRHEYMRNIAHFPYITTNQSGFFVLKKTVLHILTSINKGTSHVLNLHALALSWF